MPDELKDWGSWRLRRRFMFLVSAFCMLVIAYCLYKDLTSAVAEAAVTMAFFSLLGIVGSYVFGATWQDVSTANRLARATAPSHEIGSPVDK
jgi:hypothetical protein